MPLSVLRSSPAGLDRSSGGHNAIKNMRGIFTYPPVISNNYKKLPSSFFLFFQEVSFRKVPIFLYTKVNPLILIFHS